MRALLLAAALSWMATAAAAADICAPAQVEQDQVEATMKRVKDPDLAALGAAKPSVVGCGVWSLEIGDDGKVKSVEPLRLKGGEPLRGVVEPWLKALRFQPSPQDWTGIMPVTLEGDEKK
jgi:hypothetical protein